MAINSSLRTGLGILMVAASTVFAQAPNAGTKDPAPAASAPPTSSNKETAFKQEELDQLAAPISLYPDSLIAQILMASTYPLEVVQADRWASQNKLKGDELARELEKQTWDDSVKSLVNFPQVLSMMSEKLDWTTNLGDAFLAQRKEVMDAIQRLRRKAKENGNLESNEQQKVIVEPAASAPAGESTTTKTTVTETYIIESADPKVVYVPTYNPTVVYGAWPYPAYPPYYYYPPGYVAGTAALSFGLGVSAGAAWSHAYGGCNWGHGDVDVDIDSRSFSSNRVNSSRTSNVNNLNTNRQGNRSSWQHDPSHRKGTSYRDQGTANKFGGASKKDVAQARDSFRGRAESGRQDIARGGADQFKGGQSPSAATRDVSDRGGPGNREQSADRNRAGGQDRSAQGQGNRGGAFDDVGKGSSTRKESQRGQASRSSPSRTGGSRSASGGGMSRGGGSRGGGRGGGRR